MMFPGKIVVVEPSDTNAKLIAVFKPDEDKDEWIEHTLALIRKTIELWSVSK